MKKIYKMYFTQVTVINYIVIKKNIFIIIQLVETGISHSRES